MSQPNDFQELVISSSSFPQTNSIKFPFVASKILILNDSLKEIYYSFNGCDIDGQMKWDEFSHTLTEVTVGRIWFKTPTPDANIRVFAWARI